MDMARVEIPVSGWTCLRTGNGVSMDASHFPHWVGPCFQELTLVNVRRVGLLAGLAALLLVASGSGGGLLASLLLLSRGLAANGGLATGGGLLLSGLWGHFECGLKVGG